MTEHQDPHELLRLAEAAGVIANWTDANGMPQTVSADTLRAVLQALELPCSDAAQIHESLAELTAEKDDVDLPPLITAEAGKIVRLPANYREHGHYFRIDFENGDRIDGRLEDTESGTVHIPAIVHPGYHRLTIGDVSTTLAVAPARCFGLHDALAGKSLADGPLVGAAESGLHSPSPSASGAPIRLWGLAAQLYALRRIGDGGIGDYSALAMLARAAGKNGAAALAISPAHAMFSADRHRISPYGPSSRLFLNALHVDPAAVLGDEALEQAMCTLDADGREQHLQLEQPDMIDWPQASALRLVLLRQLHRQFRQSHGSQRAAFDAFCAQGGEALFDHARFEALHAALTTGPEGDSRHHNWRNWPSALQDPRSAEVSEFADHHVEEVEFHVFLQWQAARGLAAAQQATRDAGMPIGLIADLAVGAETGGSQAWSRQAEMINGLSIGAPPDALNALGQSWGLAAFSPRALRRTGYRAYIEMLRAVFAHAGGIRIDHVLGLGRLWLVPDGATATQGAYLRYPIDDLLRLVALESWRHRAIVIGEDLGTVPPGFRDHLASVGALGIQVLLFERDGTRFKSPDQWSPAAMATTSTHDTPTFAGWWEGRDVGWRTQLNLLPEGVTEESEWAGRRRDRTALWQTLIDTGCATGAEPPAEASATPISEALTLLGKSVAPLVMLPLEDAMALPEQPNLPGTIDTHPNWRRRLPLTVDRMMNDPAVIARIGALRRARADAVGSP